MSRRTVRTETVEQRRSDSAKSGIPSKALPRFLSVTRHDIPIIILIACLLLIAATFVYERVK